MNLDQYHPEGKPNPSLLAGFTHVRLPFYWRRYPPHSETMQQAIARQQPYIQSLLSSGLKVILVITHQNGLEGRGYNWDHMTASDWTRCIDEYTQNIQQVIGVFGASVIYQVWNEPDGEFTGKSVLMPPTVYGQLYNRVKAASGSATVMFAGLKSGPESAYDFYRKSGVKPDAIGIHEYGRGETGYSDLDRFGSILESLRYWKSRISGIPLYVTEWGVLDNKKLPVDRATIYAKAFVKACESEGVVNCWYAWSHQMDNGYGVVDNGHVRTQLLEALKPTTPTTPPPPVSGDSWVRYTLEIPYKLNVRSSPVIDSKENNIIHTLSPGSHTLDIDERSFEAASNHRWKRIRLSNAAIGWIALLRGQVKKVL